MCKKAILLVTVVLLSCSNALAQEVDSSSTGKLITNDSTSQVNDIVKNKDSVTIEMRYIREANAKLIERIYLIKLSNRQDSIINLKELYIEGQDKVIQDLKDRINTVNRLNLVLQDKCDKEGKRKRVWRYIGVGATAGLGILILSK